MLPVSPLLEPLFPDGGLRRGTVVRVRSSTAVLLAVMAEASATGTWSAVVGLPELGVVAAAEAGLALERVALIPRPGSELVAVLSALIEGVELIAVADTQRLRAGDRQRLGARARQHGSVLLAVGDWPGADLELALETHPGQWQGIGADGHGRLRARRIQIRATGRGMAHRERKVAALLPGPHGALSEIGWPERTVVATTRRKPPGSGSIPRSA